VFTIIVAILAYDFLMVTLIVTKPDRNDANLYAIVSMIIFNPIAWRAAMCSVAVSQAGVRVVNMFKTFELSWGEISQFDIGQSGLFPQVCRIHTRDGKMLRAFGIQEANVSLLQSQGKRPARKIVAQLNQELAAHTS
jgi:Bacterial PH domain